MKILALNEKIIWVWSGYINFENVQNTDTGKMAQIFNDSFASIASKCQDAMRSQVLSADFSQCNDSMHYSINFFLLSKRVKVWRKEFVSIEKNEKKAAKQPTQ